MDDAARKLAESVHETLNAIEGVGSVPVADRPVTLEDADLFNVGGNWLANDEIAEQRRALANAISAEKWMQGAKVAVALLKLLM